LEWSPRNLWRERGPAAMPGLVAFCAPSKSRGAPDMIGPGWTARSEDRRMGVEHRDRPPRLRGNGPGTPGGNGNNGGGTGNQTGVVTKTKPKTKKPSMYKVLLLNDDYTPMEFVVHVLERFFRKSREEATRIMLHVHQKGIGICGVYPYEIAETKVMQVVDFARQHQHPLQCTMEKE